MKDCDLAEHGVWLGKLVNLLTRMIVSMDRAFANRYKDKKGLDYRYQVSDGNSWINS